GDLYSEKMFTRPWDLACENLGIEGVSLYPGTRHSSVIGLKPYKSPEQIKGGTGHNTHRSFTRYFMLDEDDLRETYSMTREKQGGKGLAKISNSVSC
ncbi:MAG: hypothetical protein KJ573_14560, partial [Proteobacteria bacterium]|nr:hypothetical protein [Pseudomonadota bacterium]